MAESTSPENTTQTSTSTSNATTTAENGARFFCHICRTQVNVSADFNCVRCSNGFVEEISNSWQSLAFPNLDFFSTNHHSSGSVSGSGGGSDSSNTSLANNQLSSFHEELGHHNSTTAAAGSTNNPNASGEVQPQPLNWTDFFLYELMRESNPESGGTVETGGSNGAPTRSSNIADATSQEERSALANDWRQRFRAATSEFLDRFFSNELDNFAENMRTSLGPLLVLNLTQERIDRIPKIEISEEDIAKYDECSICWESFVLHESVRKLPCSHLFHDLCIVPWLKQHRTCPICRDRLSNDEGLQAAGNIGGERHNAGLHVSVDLSENLNDDDIDNAGTQNEASNVESLTGNVSNASPNASESK